MRSIPSRARRALAFTLVELLVVIGIIALLISILLPALGKARSQAQIAQCMSGLRQVGIAYRMYAEANRGYLPYIRNHVWKPDSSLSDSAQSVYWYKAIAPFLNKAYDPFGDDASARIPKVIGSCPTWFQWQDSNDVSNNWRPGYGQNLYLYRGSGQSVTGSKGVTAAGDDANIGIDGLTEASWRKSEPYCVGVIKLASIRPAANKILAGDAVQYWMGVGKAYPEGFAEQNLRFDFDRAIDDGPPGSDTSASVFATTGWKGGHPNRHGGLLSDCPANAKGGKATKARANYLFADGHVNTLSYLEARRAMQNK